MNETFTIIFATFIPTMLFSLIIGILFGARIDQKREIGTLKVDSSDPYEEPYLFLELSGNVDNIIDEEYVTLKVDVTGYTTQN